MPWELGLIPKKFTVLSERVAVIRVVSCALFQLEKEQSQVGEVSFLGGFKETTFMQRWGSEQRKERDPSPWHHWAPKAHSGLPSWSYYSTAQEIKSFLKRLAPFHRTGGRGDNTDDPTDILWNQKHLPCRVMRKYSEQKRTAWLLHDTDS